MNNLACSFGFHGFREDYATLDHQVDKDDVTVCVEHAPTVKNPLRRTATLKRLSLISLCANAHKGGRGANTPHPPRLKAAIASSVAMPLQSSLSLVWRDKRGDVSIDKKPTVKA